MEIKIWHRRGLRADGTLVNLMRLEIFEAKFSGMKIQWIPLVLFALEKETSSIVDSDAQCSVSPLWVRNEGVELEFVIKYCILVMSFVFW